MKKFITFLFCLGFAMGETKLYTKTLENGLKIIVIPNGKAPVANVAVVYNVGTADDPLDACGLSHFLEHMMFMGTDNVPSDEFKKMIQRHGGSPNAFTGWDYTVYHCSIAIEHIDLLLKMEADRMVNLSFTKKEIESERSVVMQERLMRLENHPFGQVWEVALKAFSLYHPYGVPPIGYPEHIRNYHFENTRAHYKKWYAPNNATVIVCGKVVPEEAFVMVEKHFKDLKKGEIPKRAREPNPPRQGITQLISQKNPRNAQVLYEATYDCPHHSQDKKMALATCIIAQLMGGSEITDFYEHFVLKKKIALQISTSYDPFTLNPFGFNVMATLSPKIKMKIFKKELKSYIEKRLQEGFRETEILEAKSHYLNHFQFMFDGNEEMIDLFVGLSCGYSLTELQNWKEDINSLTRQDINKAFCSIFEKNPVVICELFPEKE
jgi:zinc protease